MKCYLAPKGTVLVFESALVTMEEPWFLSPEALLSASADVTCFDLTKESDHSPVDLTKNARQEISADALARDFVVNLVSHRIR